jgi:DNA-directed RNA polymerase II subunit RPB2
VLTERLFEQSDPFVATVCGKCGMLAHPESDKTLLRHKHSHCRNCGTTNDVHAVRMPYAFKLLLQELMAMNIAARLRLVHTHSEQPFTHEKPDLNLAWTTAGDGVVV